MSKLKNASMLTVTMAAGRPSYKPGELPDFSVTFANSGEESILVSTYMLDYRLKSAMVANPTEGDRAYELQPFQPGAWERPEAGQLKKLAPGESLTVKLELSQQAEFRFVPRDNQPVILTPSSVLARFPRGDCKFATAMTAKVALYRGEPNVYDRQLEVKELQEIHGRSDLFLEWTEVSCNVRFE